MPEAPKNILEKKPPTPAASVSDDEHVTKLKITKKSLQYIEDVTSNADEVQERVLAEILARSSNVEYLQRHGLNGHTDRETFKSVMPIVTYEDLKPDIDRIANGDSSPILCSKPISEFLTR